jgi:hypothetical protein
VDRIVAVIASIEFAFELEVPCKPIELPLVGIAIPPRALPLIMAAFAEVVETRDKSPALTATTVPSAMRLRSVFVDMYILSISRSSLS